MKGDERSIEEELSGSDIVLRTCTANLSIKA
jgi:hypothetical protein